MGKRKYEKPYIDVEEFSVIDYISSCNVLTSISMPLNCNEPPSDSMDMIDIYYGFPEVFTTECETDFENFNYLSYCYHTPTGSTVIFIS